MRRLFAIEEYIHFYNTKRYQKRLHCMTPMKNDDGSIPCETADVILVNPVYNRSKGLVLGQGFRPDLGRCIRIPKRCLCRRVDSISPEQLWAVDCSFYNRYGCRPTESVHLP